MFTAAYEAAILAEYDAAERGQEVVGLDIEVHLAPDVGEAATAFEQCLLEPVGQGPLDVFLAGSLGQGEEIENVRIFGELLGELGVRFGQVAGEVRRRDACPLMEAADDRVEQHLPGPAMLKRGGRVPVPLGGGVELVQQHRDVTTGQLTSRLLAIWVREPRPRAAAVAEAETVRCSRLAGSQSSTSHNAASVRRLSRSGGVRTNRDTCASDGAC